MASNSPGWGHGPGGECWSQMGSLLLRLGKHWRRPMPGLMDSWCKPTAAGWWQTIWSQPGWRSCLSARGTSVAWQMRQPSWKHGFAGNLGTLDGWTHVQITHPESKPGPIPKLEHSGPWLDGWQTLGLPADLYRQRASGVVKWHPNGAAVAAKTNVTIAWEERGWTLAAGRQHKGSPHGNKPGGDLTWLMAMWSGATCMSMATPVRCGDDEEASASSRTALNASELVMSARVKEWRAQHFMENDDDFAYAFASYDQAVVAGGHGLATEWLEVRAEQEEQLIPAAAAVVAALKPGEPSKILKTWLMPPSP